MEIISIGFLPYLSENAPKTGDERNCRKLYKDPSIPEKNSPFWSIISKNNNTAIKYVVVSFQIGNSDQPLHLLHGYVNGFE